MGMRLAAALVASKGGPLPWLDKHPDTVTAGATVVLVIVTVVYVVLTRQMVTATRALAEEAQRDRDIAHQPYLAWRIDTDEKTGGRIATVVNNSPADAYLCFLILERTSADGGAGSWLRSGLFAVGPHDEPYQTRLDTVVSDDPPRDLPLAREVAFGQNQFGERFCWQALTTDMQRWKPSAKSRRSPEPSWVTWYDQVLEARRRQPS
jgi:hypothetical protein